MSLESFSTPPPLPNQEKKENIPEIEAVDILQQSRLSRIIHNKDVQQGLLAMARTVINSGISAIDFVPIVGEAASWSADLLKSHTVKWILRKLKLPEFDLTPDVSRTVAWGTELLEKATIGVAPTHLAETIVQLAKKDWGLMKQAFLSIKEINREEKQKKESQKELALQAAQTFIDKK